MASRRNIALALAGLLAVAAAIVAIVVIGGDSTSPEQAAATEAGQFPGISPEAQPADGADTGRADPEQRRKQKALFRKKQRQAERIHRRAERVKRRNLSKYKKRYVEDFNQPIILEQGEVTRIERPFRAAVPLVIKSKRDDTLHVEGYELRQPVKAGEYGHLTFDASMSGRFTIELEKSGEKIAVLIVAEPKK